MRIEIAGLKYPLKRFIAVFPDGKRVPFGQRGAHTYLDGASEEKRKAYIARHRVNEDWSDPKKAGTLARFILWQERSLSKALLSIKNGFIYEQASRKYLCKPSKEVFW
jgi:hypothetical protein